MTSLKWWAALCAVVALAPQAVAQAPAPWAPPTRALEVLRDELPDRIETDELTLAIEGAPEQCSPQAARVPLLGSAGLTRQQRAMQLVCSRILLWASSGRDSPRVLTTLPRIGERNPAAVAVAMRELGVRTRYAAAMRWEADHTGRVFTWHSEEFVFDLEAQRWLWHAARRNDAPIYNNIPVAEVARDLDAIVARVLGEQLPATLLRRGQARQPANALGARWETAEALAGPPEAGMARIVIVGDYAMLEDSVHSDARPVAIARVGDAAARLETAAPRFSVSSLLVAPGTYEHWAPYGTAQRDLARRELAAGSELVLRVVRGFSNATNLEVKDRAWLDEALAQRLRHAFLADTRPNRAYAYRPWFVAP